MIKKDSFKCILWDNDGVLVDTETLYFKATKEIFEKYTDTLITWELFEQYFLFTNRGSLGLCQLFNFSDNIASTISIERDKLYADNLGAEIPVIDGVIETLEKLHGKIPMGIVTSCKRNHLEIMHSNTGILKYIDFIIANEDVEATKPDPEPYIKGYERSGFDKSDILVVEDAVRGLKSAINAGISCAVIPRYINDKDAFKQADYILDSIIEIVPLMDII